jgi:biopolymer transport protein TolR
VSNAQEDTVAMDVSRARGGAISTINVTPMADVIIVLLIIFMVTIPVITRQVDLPDARMSREKTDGPIIVTVRGHGEILLSGEGSIPIGQLSARIQDRLARSDGLIQLNADEGLPYDQVAAVLSACRRAGADEVAIMTEPKS